MRGTLASALFAFLSLGCAAAPAAQTDEACAAGVWFDPASGAVRRHDEVLAEAARRQVVLLGETHDNVEHHRWQLSTLAGLLALEPRLAVGFEAFPARVQPVLDRWVAGELDQAAFLAEAQWRQVWNLEPELYLPLFHLARLHRVPMVALNTDRELVARVGREGWAAVPPAERQGVGDPAPAGAGYLDRLEGVYRRHPHAPTGDGGGRDDPAFGHFVDAQLTWDRAMAEALVRARDDLGVPLVVGVIGSEHLRHRNGVPHQLADLGVADAAVLLPHDRGQGCSGLVAGEADAVFVLDRPESSPSPRRPRLGVELAARDGEVRAMGVMPGSVAEASGLRRGDVILEAGGRAVTDQEALVGIVRGTAPGTWLPMLLRRDGRTLEAVAKFPREPDTGP